MSEHSFLGGLRHFHLINRRNFCSLEMLNSQGFDPNTKFDRRIMFDMLSSDLSCQPAGICLVDHAPTTKDGVQYKGVFLYFEYSPAVNELLKTSGHAFFSRPKTAWRLCPDHEGTDLKTIQEMLYLHFQYLIDIRNECVYENRAFSISA